MGINLRLTGNKMKAFLIIVLIVVMFGAGHFVGTSSSDSSRLELNNQLSKSKNKIKNLNNKVKSLNEFIDKEKESLNGISNEQLFKMAEDRLAVIVDNKYSEFAESIKSNNGNSSDILDKLNHGKSLMNKFMKKYQEYQKGNSNRDTKEYIEDDNSSI